MRKLEPAAGETFDNVRERQILLGLELLPAERLAWLDARREEMLRLQQLMAPPQPSAE